MAATVRKSALALARRLGVDESRATNFVETCGAADVLAAMALPPQYRTAFLERVPDARVPFIDGLIASGA